MSEDRHKLHIATGVEIPLVGFGTYLVPPQEAAAAVKDAVVAGYRHFDTAAGYGNEAEVGAGIKAGLLETGLNRDDVIVTTKVFPGNAAWNDPPLTYNQILGAFEASNAALGLGHIDLYLLHAPSGGSERINQWRALVDLKAAGKARAIGVSNYLAKHIEEMTAAGLPLPDANQIELHPWSQKPTLVEYLKANDITIIAYSSLAPLSNWRDGQESAKTDAMKAEGDHVASPFKEMATDYGVTEAQLLLRWGVQNGYAVLPKSLNPARMRENLEIFNFSIDAVDMAAISKMDRGGGIAWPHGDPTAFG